MVPDFQFQCTAVHVTSFQSQFSSVAFSFYLLASRWEAKKKTEDKKREVHELPDKKREVHELPDTEIVESVNIRFTLGRGKGSLGPATFYTFHTLWS